jgi:hypothetical protein
MNLYGEEIRSLKPQIGITEIKISDLSSGIYYIKYISSEINYKSGKIIKP